VVLAVAILLWTPRFAGPIDLRWDGAVHYILGTSLAEGRGYKLLNEPGEIDEVQYPPLLPAVVALHQLLLGTSDPTRVGRLLRLSSFFLFIAYACVVFRFLRSYLPGGLALLASLMSLFCLHAWFLSDALFPEVGFSIATLLFLLFARREGSRGHAALAYLCALASYALRSVGIAAFAVLVLHSLLRRRFKQAAGRAMLALLPILAWQVYVARVEQGYAYNHPAYEYQRAPYMFYNVSYARNVALRDPFTPEKGDVRVARRVVRNLLELPVHLGETLSARGYLQMALHGVFGEGRIAGPLIDRGMFAVLSVFGGVLVAGGLVVQLLRRQLLVPLYLMVYSAALCLTPFPDQYLRYLMPVTPLVALSAIVCLTATQSRRGGQPDRGGREALRAPLAVLGPALLVQLAVTIFVYAREYQPIAYVDAKGQSVGYRLFFYNESQRGFDQSIDYIRTHARPTDVVAAGTPHWIYLRTRLKTVMPPFERDAGEAQRLLDSVPARYLIVGRDVIGSERYTEPMVKRFPEYWEQVYATTAGGWTVYRRADR
jgi:hypothetical protein